ncbi:preprotein translocase subunit SecG [Pseudomonas cremoricolorata]|uniref:preprotein translocase subunit SecG n=1 Tax=Pseudomonas cremoricolorata TaxID=157783 RepID=UPI0009DBB777|nr:preprotein translocase subunit SecG [Pseudomonas cremoricolorata]
MLETVVVVFHLLAALALVALVLMQQGKGAEAGASFGAGASNTVFGSQGSATFLSKFTAILAATFFLTALGLGYFAKEQAHQLSQAGLPDPAVLEVKEQKSEVNDDVPMLQEQKSETTQQGDVPPPVEEQK